LSGSWLFTGPLVSAGDELEVSLLADVCGFDSVTTLGAGVGVGTGVGLGVDIGVGSGVGIGVGFGVGVGVGTGVGLRVGAGVALRCELFFNLPISAFLLINACFISKFLFC